MLSIYDSLSGEKKVFVPVHPGEVRMYTCGMTVYDVCHIGHARSMIVFDVVARYFRHLNYQVIWVRNITDVDDKIINRAKENGETCESLTARSIAQMHEDEKALGLSPVDHEPRATEFITQIIALIQKLIDEDVAYIAENDDVCFSVRSFSSYGKLANRDIEKLIAGSRIDIQEGKRDPLDFVLWKCAKPNEPQWNSPWGKGRPGWHIECSAMATSLLGQPFDIHGGGMDLKFPHHENEIAQSEAAYHVPFANIWMHVGLLTVNDEKMSKSLNNFFTIQEVLTEYHPETIRYFMISSHYQSPVNYSKENLQKASQSLNTLYTAMRGLNIDLVDERTIHNNFEIKFHEAMDDDFNTPIALSALFEIAHEINRFRQAGELNHAALLAKQLKTLGGVLGILQIDSEKFLQGHHSDDFAKQIEMLIEKRKKARQQKNWQEADHIRKTLQAMDVLIEDSDKGTTWRKS